MQQENSFKPINTLICMVGLPRAGKSTIALKMNYPIVNIDSIRLALHGQAFIPEAEELVWSMAMIFVRSLFNAGHAIVTLDATNTTIERRKKWISKDWQTVFCPVKTSKEECIERAISSGKDYLIPVIERMSESFEDFSEKELSKCLIIFPTKEEMEENHGRLRRE
jgi:predicted kinase